MDDVRGVPDGAPGPSEVEDFLRCPVYRQWRRAGWRPRVAGPADLAAAIGHAVHAGLAVLYQRWSEDPLTTSIGKGTTLADAMDAMLRAWQEGAATLAGRTDGARLYEPYAKPAARALERYATEHLHKDRWEIVAVETPIGRARPDLVVREQGALVVVDFKVKREAWRKGEWERKDAFARRTAWQLYDYAWRVSTHYGEPVARCDTRTLALTPQLSVTAEPVALAPAALAQWRTWAERVWAQMETPPVGNLTRCADWGWGSPCVYYDACWVYHGDPARMAVDYARVPVPSRPTSIPGIPSIATSTTTTMDAGT